MDEDEKKDDSKTESLSRQTSMLSNLYEIMTLFPFKIVETFLVKQSLITTFLGFNSRDVISCMSDFVKIVNKCFHE